MILSCLALGLKTAASQVCPVWEILRMGQLRLETKQVLAQTTEIRGVILPSPASV